MSEPIRTSDGLYGFISRMKPEPVETPADPATAKFLREVFKAPPVGRLIRMDDQINANIIDSSAPITRDMTEEVLRRKGILPGRPRTAFQITGLRDESTESGR